jgi:hypothetical protein
MTDGTASGLTDANTITGCGTTEDKVFKITGIVTTDTCVAHAMSGTLFLSHRCSCSVCPQKKIHQFAKIVGVQRRKVLNAFQK